MPFFKFKTTPYGQRPVYTPWGLIWALPAGILLWATILYSIPVVVGWFTC